MQLWNRYCCLNWCNKGASCYQEIISCLDNKEGTEEESCSESKRFPNHHKNQQNQEIKSWREESIVLYTINVFLASYRCDLEVFCWKWLIQSCFIFFLPHVTTILGGIICWPCLALSGGLFVAKPAVDGQFPAGSDPEGWYSQGTKPDLKYCLSPLKSIWEYYKIGMNTHLSNLSIYSRASPQIYKTIWCNAWSSY